MIGGSITGKKEEKESVEKGAGRVAGGIKYGWRAAGNELLITGMCIRVWPKQI